MMCIECGSDVKEAEFINEITKMMARPVLNRDDIRVARSKVRAKVKSYICPDCRKRKVL